MEGETGQRASAPKRIAFAALLTIVGLNGWTGGPLLAERILAGMVVVAFVLFEVWFFFFSASPIDNRTGRTAVDPPAISDGGRTQPLGRAAARLRRDYSRSVTTAVQRLETLYRDWSRGDFKSSADVLHPAVEWHQARESVEPGVRHGRSGVTQMTRGVFEAFRDFRVEALEFRMVGEQVLVLSRLRGTSRGTGMDLDRTAAQLWTFAGKQAIRVEWYPDATAALAAAGSA